MALFSVGFIGCIRNNAHIVVCTTTKECERLHFCFHTDTPYFCISQQVKQRVLQKRGLETSRISANLQTSAAPHGHVPFISWKQAVNELRKRGLLGDTQHSVQWAVNHESKCVILMQTFKLTVLTKTEFWGGVFRSHSSSAGRSPPRRALRCPGSGRSTGTRPLSQGLCASLLLQHSCPPDSLPGQSKQSLKPLKIAPHFPGSTGYWVAII